MRPRPLYTLHPTPLAVLYSDLENHAAVTQEVLIGTPGILEEAHPRVWEELAPL